MNEKTRNLINSITAISIGTIAGIVCYYLFLKFNIAIFGWNLGLVIAPLFAGYVEVFIANKISKKSTGAVSAFILFIITVIYGFFMTNPTLGANLLTAGITVIILQAAFPIAVNYLLIVGGLKLLNYILKNAKKIKRYFQKLYCKYIKGVDLAKKEKIIIRRQQKINTPDFLFVSANHIENYKIEEYVGFFESRIYLDRAKTLINTDDNIEEVFENLTEDLEEGSTDALVKLKETVKKNNGNCLLDLSIEYDIVNATTWQISAKGTGVKIKKIEK